MVIILIREPMAMEQRPGLSSTRTALPLTYPEVGRPDPAQEAFDADGHALRHHLAPAHMAAMTSRRSGAEPG
jgi:hypothetical protein